MERRSTCEIAFCTDFGFDDMVQVTEGQGSVESPIPVMICICEVGWHQQRVDRVLYASE